MGQDDSEQIHQKWKCNDIHNRSLITDFLNKYEGEGVKVRPADVVNVLKRVRRQKVLDHCGCSPLGMLIVAEALPDQVSQVFEAAAASRSCMQDVMVKGRALAKVSGSITSEKIRVLLPLPVSLANFRRSCRERLE